MTDDRADSAEGGEPDTAEAPAPRGRRGLIILALCGAVAIALVVVAILVVPGVVTGRQAQTAADAFAAERDQWRAAFTEEALEPYVFFEDAEYGDYWNAVSAVREATDIAWTTPSTASESAELEAACSAIADLADGLAAFEGVDLPHLEEIDGGERNADYAAAQELYARELPRYEASAVFVEEARAGFSDMAEGCAYFIAGNAVDRELVEAMNAYVAMHTMENEERLHIGTEQRAGQTVDHWIVCGNEHGCIPYDDLEVRATAGDLWDAASEARHLAAAELLAANCPGSLQEACDAFREVELTLHAASEGIGEAFRAEDPVTIGRSVADGESVTPQLHAAQDEYNTAWRAEYDALAERIEELTGFSSLSQAVDRFAAAAASRISEAAASVSDS